MEEPLDDKIERLAKLKNEDGSVVVQVVIGSTGFGVAVPGMDIDGLPSYRSILLLEGLSMVRRAIGVAVDVEHLDDGPIKTAAKVAEDREAQLRQIVGRIEVERAVKAGVA